MKIWPMPRGSGKTWRMMMSLINMTDSGLLVFSEQERYRIVLNMEDLCKNGKIRTEQLNSASLRIFTSPEEIAGTNVRHIMIDNIEMVINSLVGRMVSAATCDSISIVPFDMNRRGKE